MPLAMNVLCQHSLPLYIAEWKGCIIVQAPSLQKRHPISLIVRLAYNIYSPSTPFALILFSVRISTVSFSSIVKIMSFIFSKFTTCEAL